MKKKLNILLILLLYSCSTLNIKSDTQVKTNDEKNGIILYNDLSTDTINNNFNIKNVENIKSKIRVKLSVINKESLSLKLDNKNVRLNGEKISSELINIKAVGNKIQYNNKYYESIEILNENGIIEVGKLKYYGNFIIKSIDSKLDVVNILDMEKYLLGVLPYEIPNGFPMEALKAQAIISRTYAYKNIERSKKEFDLYDDTRSQVYQGIPQKDINNIRQAIESTKNLVIKYKGATIDALFHSYSGGYTASSKEVYGNHLDYLISVEDKYSAYTPSNILNWNYIIPSSIIFKEIGFIPVTFDISYTESNRVSSITLYNEDKSILKKYTGQEFRRKFSTTKIKSTVYTIDIIEGGINVIGSGFGHGVGFSQWSSKAMAEDYGMKYDEIIKFFYNGVEIMER